MNEILSIPQAIFLGCVQGLTEFLPISSSGHLVILQQLMGIEAQGSFLLDFDFALHVGTFFSVMVALYGELWEMVRSSWRVGRACLQRRTISWDELFQNDIGVRLIVMVTLATFPVAVLGLLFRDALEGLFTSLRGAGLMLIVTGFILWSHRYFHKPQRPFSQVSLFQAFLVGMAQAVALIPGISRSGTTIVTALGLGWHRELAAKFSFLLLVPAILGGLILEWSHLGHWSPGEQTVVLSGALTAAITGFIAIKFLLYVMRQGSLRYFSYYCWGVGSLVVLYSFLKLFF